MAKRNADGSQYLAPLQELRKRKSSNELGSLSQRRKVQGGSSVEEIVQHSARQNPSWCDEAIAIEPAGSNMSDQGLAKNLMKEFKEARRQKEERGKHKGWVFDTLKGHCCNCESNDGFSRFAERCRSCRHKFCLFCTTFQDTSKDATEDIMRAKLEKDNEKHI